jgi:hypothetical protein
MSDAEFAFYLHIKPVRISTMLCTARRKKMKNSDSKSIRRQTTYTVQDSPSDFLLVTWTVLQ